ncbi:hypothetical protein P9112_008924 [Eukaryota sp. TZLM1-RC]
MSSSNSRCSSPQSSVDQENFSFQSESESFYDEPTYHHSSSRPSTRKRRRRKVTDILVCLDNCKYEVVANCVQALKWKIVDETEDWNLYWMDRSVNLERVLKLNPYQCVNHFPGMSEIARKDNLARNLTRMHKLHPEEYDFFPLTWVIPQEIIEFRNYLSKKKTRSTFISKPDASCQGKGIFLTRNPLDDIDEDDNCVVQEYLSKPYLINNTKFDLRIYCLVFSVDPLIIYYYNKGLARFCTEPYSEPTGRNLDNAFVHLTNYAINKTNENFVQNSNSNQDDEGSKWSLLGVVRHLTSEGHDAEVVFNQIKEAIIKTLIAIQPTLAHTYRTVVGATSQSGRSLCFEILGFDFLIDSKLKPHLLEVNHSPSFSCDSPLDLEIKQSLISDTLQLLSLSRTDKKAWKKEQKKKFKQRLYGKKAVSKKEVTGQKFEVLSSFGDYELIYDSSSSCSLSNRFSNLVVPPTTLAETTSSRMRRANVEKKLKEREAEERKEKERRERREKKVRAGNVSSRVEVNSLPKKRPPPPAPPVVDPVETSPAVSRAPSVADLHVTKPYVPVYLDLPAADRRITDNLIGRVIEETTERSRLYERVVRENLLKNANIKDFVYRLFRQPSVKPTPIRSGSTLGHGAFSLRAINPKRKPIVNIMPQEPREGSFRIPMLSGTALVPQQNQRPRKYSTG